jgi:hypothetical protein
MDNGLLVPSRQRPLRASGGTPGGRSGGDEPSKPVGRRRRQIRGVVDRGVTGRRGLRAKPHGSSPHGREKPLARTLPPVPQTDTGGLVEHTEVDGRPSVKELGNLAP